MGYKSDYSLVMAPCYEANQKLLMVDYENIQRWIANTSQTRYVHL